MNLKKIENLYSKNIRKLGVSSKAVGWNSRESQYLRFEKLLLLIDFKEEFSINELGCGYGELYKFLINNNYSFSSFNGYDISKEMLKKCENYLNYPNNLNLYHSSNIETLSDYTIASGIFNIPFDNTQEEWQIYINKTIENMYKFSTKGIAFNFLTSYVDYKADNLYYQNPEEIFRFCIENYGRNIQIIHNYNLYEFTVIIEK